LVHSQLPQPAPPPKADAVSLEGFGSHCFWGKEAEKYLVAEGLALSDLTDPMWVHDIRKADQIAAAVLKWGVAHGASYFCHWFQPMASTARHGQSGQVQSSTRTM
jgi:glutamine synthetase